MSCKSPQQKIQNFQLRNAKLYIVGFFRVRTKFHASHHWELALLKIPSGNTSGLWCERLNNNTWKEQREICSGAYGKFKMCQVVKDDIPVFFIEAFRSTCNGNRWTEERIVHQVGFLCVTLMMCVYQITAYVLYKKNSPVMLLLNTHHISFFHRLKNSSYKLKWGVK